MLSIRDPEFPGEIFDDEWSHPCGTVLLRYLGKSAGAKRSMKWGIRKGSSYPPETHAHGHTLYIEKGTGIVSIHGVERAYGPGQSFFVHGNVPHGFVRVDSATVVVQGEL